MAEESKAQTPTVGSEEWKGPQTQEEASCFHNGFLSGLTVYARETGHSTLKSDNPLLARLMDEQGWKTIEAFEKLPKPDWRIGHKCKPKRIGHGAGSFEAGERGKIIQVHPSGFGNIIDPDGVLMIQMGSGSVFLDKADNWITA